MLIWEGKYRGLADSKWSGAKGSFYRSVGIDGHSEPGVLKARQKLSRISVQYSASASVSPSASSSPSASTSISPSASASPSASSSRSPSSSASPSASVSPSSSSSASVSPSSSYSPSASASGSPSSSISASVSASTPASEVDEFIKVAVNASNGYSFWFSSTSGKIWAEYNDTFTLAYTTVPTSGDAGCLGAIEYNGYIYWATESYLHRIAIADADDQWVNAAYNWNAFDITDDSWHPMTIQQSATGPELFIGDGYQIAGVDANGTFNGNLLDINTPLRIKCMTTYELDVVLGTYVADTVNKAEIIRWDTVSTAWNISDHIEENGVNAFLRDDNYLYAQVGQAGSWYFYNGAELQPAFKVPGSYSDTAYATVHPNATGNIDGMPVFGFSNGSGNPALQGVYVLGSYSRNYDKVMDLSFPISENVTSGIEIGAIITKGFDMYVSWKYGDTYGIDKIDYDNKYDGAYVETMLLAQDKRDKLKTLGDINVLYNDLPTNTDITISYANNNGSYTELTGIDDTILRSVRAEFSDQAITAMQVKVALTTSGNDTPKIETMSLNLN